MRGLAALALVLICCAPQAARGDRPCLDHFAAPGKPPDLTTEYNGIRLEDVCLNKPGPHHVFAIGDWGGVLQRKQDNTGQVLIPADRRSPLFPTFGRSFVWGVDDVAQRRVAGQMQKLAETTPPDFMLNLGDMFYWTGVDGVCGGPPVVDQMSIQFAKVFEEVYDGLLAGVPFLGVLGNHDYGGYRFTSAWQENIGYTWGGNMPRILRWFLPALYWEQRVRYPDLSIDMLFVDTNLAETWDPQENQGHNLCSEYHNTPQGTCGNQGPTDLNSCRMWFQKVWADQEEWLHERLGAAIDATYQIVVTHYPPSWFVDMWNCLSDKYGIDLFIGGHTHVQQVFAGNTPENPVRGGTCTVISGGGGGITSEGSPTVTGEDDMYGFMDLVLTPGNMEIRAVSHSGLLRSSTICPGRAPRLEIECPVSVASRRLRELQQTASAGNATLI